MVAKFVLDDFEQEENLWFALTSAKPATSLVFALNHDLGLSMHRTLQDPVLKINNQKFSFAQYEYQDDWASFAVVFRENQSLQNQGEENVKRLIKRTFPVDFIIQVSREGGGRIKSALSSLQQKGEIQFFTPLQPKNKSEEALLFFDLMDH